ncbi:MAG: LamG-like jellyroll fold domain-containing protein, partial [Planctomycetota bacterium]
MPVCYDEICYNEADDDFDGTTDCADSDCSAASSFSVSASVTDEVCGAGGGAIDLTVSGSGSPFSYRWADMAESAWWNFEKSPDDASGNSRHDNGVTGTLVYSSDAVEGRHSAYFDGNTYVRYSVDNGFMEVSMTSLTVSMWIKPDNLTGVKTLFDEGGSNSNSGRGLAMRLNGSTLEASLRNGSNTLHTAGTLTVPNDGAWHHVAVVYSAGALTAYLDGTAGTTNNTNVASI